MREIIQKTIYNMVAEQFPVMVYTLSYWEQKDCFYSNKIDDVFDVISTLPPEVSKELYPNIDIFRKTALSEMENKNAKFADTLFMIKSDKHFILGIYRFNNEINQWSITKSP